MFYPNDPFLKAGLSFNNQGGQNTNQKMGQSSVSKLVQSTLPESSEVNTVQALEEDLRSEKKKQIETEQSQQVGGSGTALPDIANAQNKSLVEKAKKYAKPDNVPPPSSSVLGDFSRLLNMQSSENTQNSGLAQNQMLAMAYSTLANTTSEATRIVESQLTYDLAAASYGLHSQETNSLKKYKSGKLLDASVY